MGRGRVGWCTGKGGGVEGAVGEAATPLRRCRWLMRKLINVNVYTFCGETSLSETSLSATHLFVVVFVSKFN